MKPFSYVLRNFFTHKDYLVPAGQIPGTLFTPLSFLFEAVLLAVIVGGAVWLSRKKEKIRPVLCTIWILLLVWEVTIIAWDSLAGRTKAMDYATSLSLYPCSIFMFVLPVMLWGKGKAREMAFGYLSTLGILGAAINFLFPISRLTAYSCISFPGFHTFFYHGSMLFAYLVMVISGMHRYTGVRRWQQLFYPCIPSLIVSVPANILNYSPLGSDYMYFTGQFFVLAKLFGGVHRIYITLFLYSLYILVPALFYLPSYIANRRRQMKAGLSPAPAE